MSLIHTSLLLVLLCWFPTIYASLYVVESSSIQVCHGGQPCIFEWLDDGKAPLLTDIGSCHVALYNGEQNLIQQIQPVDVSAVHYLEFTPNPMAGPNSDQYYINFTSFHLIGNAPYGQYTSFFQLDQMSGSSQSVIPSLTSTIPLPSSLSHTSSSSSIVSANLPSSSSYPSSSRMSLSQTSSFTPLPTSATGNGATGASQSNASHRHGFPYLLWIIYCLVAFGVERII